jgi:cation diffusion facilitator family transporter
MSARTTLPGGLRDMDIASRAATLSLGSNAVLMVLKITIGLMFGSVAVLGDGIDSAEDVFASALAFFAVRLAVQPADDAHPYGHGKAESMAALSQALLIVFGALFIAGTAAYRITRDDVGIAVGPSLIVMAITVAVNVAVAGYAFRAARISGSVAIASDAKHLLTNVVQAGAVIAALVLVGVTGQHAWDIAVAMLLALYLLWTAFTIFRDALPELIDAALPESDRAAIETIIAAAPAGVRSAHELRTRKSGREKYVDMHLLVDSQLTVSEAHRCVEQIEQAIIQAVPGALVSIHVDPDEPGIMERRAHRAIENDPGLRLHSH